MGRWIAIVGLRLTENRSTSLMILVSSSRFSMRTSTRNNESDLDQEKTDQQALNGPKKPFIEPEMKEFDDLEKQIKSPLIGTFTP
jgi:hypothetical protein